MKSTAASLTLALLGTVAVSGCHQTSQRAASIASSQPVPSKQIEDYETRLSMARLDEREGKTEAAQEAYEKLVKDNPTNPLAHQRLGIIAAGAGDFDTANRNFRRAFELAPENSEVLADWGYSLFLQGKYIEAEELTRLGAELAPHDTRIAGNLSLIYQNSSLSPPVEPRMVQPMPSDAPGVILAEAIDETVAGSELELQQAGYEESIRPFEDVTLQEPALEPETVAQLLPEEAAAESEPELQRAGYEESIHPFEDVPLPEPDSETVAQLLPEEAETGSELELQQAGYEESIRPFEDVTLLEPASKTKTVAQLLPEEAAAESELELQQAGYEEGIHPFEDVTLPERALGTEVVAQLLPEKIAAEPSATVESTPVETAPAIPEDDAGSFAAVEPPAELPIHTEPFAIEPAEAAPADAASFDETSIAPEHVRKLLTRARLELAAGDVEMSHAFAEAAAENTIPLKVFQETPEKVLDEIEFVTGHNSVMSLENPAVATAEFAQVTPPAPVAYEDATTSNVSKKLTLEEVAALDPQGFRAIGRKSLSILPKLVDSDGERRLLPERRAYRKLAQVPVVKHTVGYSRDWTPLSYSWEAPQLKYNPLYFEDAQLERYGNEVCILQPFLSGARFYATIPTLPYQMMSEGNSVCHTVYDFGYARPGDCVPYALEVPEFSWTGALASGGWAFALVVILP